MISTAPRAPRVILLMLALVFFLMFVGEAATAQAAEFTVNSTADSTECAATCTLRGAIAAAEASPDTTSTILLPAETFELGAFDEAHPTSTGQLRLNNSAGTTIKIVGGGVGKTIINAAKHDRVLRTSGGGSIVLERLTLENGFPEGNEKDNTLDESVRGAGIYQDGGKVTLEHVRVTENQDNGFGAAVNVVNGGTLTLVDSELDHDAADDGWGGAVSIEDATLIATNTSLDDDNSPTGVGGAVALVKHSNGTFTNDTFADNGFIPFGDTYEGGALYLEESNATLLNVTFAGNGAFGNTHGGADISANESSHVTFTNVLLGNGLDEEPEEYACNERFNEEERKLSTWTDLGGNLGEDGTCHLASADMKRELKFGKLGNYGGPTQTVPLLEGSPAINFGVSGCPATDQRGYARVGTCDSGAFEFAAVPPKTEESGGAPGGSTTSTPPATTTNPSPGTVSSPAPSVASTPKAIEEVLLGCTKRSLVLNDVLISGGHVLLNGSATKSLVGKKVKILFDGAKQVASATVKAGGKFSTSAPLPPARLRNSNNARYLAGLRCPALAEPQAHQTSDLATADILGWGGNANRTGGFAADQTRLHSDRRTAAGMRQDQQGADVHAPHEREIPCDNQGDPRQRQGGHLQAHHKRPAKAGRTSRLPHLQPAAASRAGLRWNNVKSGERGGLSERSVPREASQAVRAWAHAHHIVLAAGRCCGGLAWLRHGRADAASASRTSRQRCSERRATSPVLCAVDSSGLELVDLATRPGSLRSSLAASSRGVGDLDARRPHRLWAIDELGYPVTELHPKRGMWIARDAIAELYLLDEESLATVGRDG